LLKSFKIYYSKGSQKEVLQMELHCHSLCSLIETGTSDSKRNNSLGIKYKHISLNILVSVAYNVYALYKYIGTTYTIDASFHWLFHSHQNCSEFLEHHGNVVIYPTDVLLV